MKKRELVQFIITNTTNSDIVFPIFQQGVSSLNSQTKYAWDVTAETFACTTATIFINSIQYPVVFASSLSSLVSSLNTLGFGTFATEIVGGNTFIYVVDNTNVYGDLQVCPASITGFAYDVSPTSALSSSLACALTGNIQLYAIEASPLSVTRFYTNINCTIAFSGDTNYYRYQLTGGGGSYNAQINLGGFVTNASGCP